MKDILAERKRIEEANAALMAQLRQMFEDAKKETEAEIEEAKKMVLFILFKLHHLIRTKVKPGVYSLRKSE